MVGHCLREGGGKPFEEVAPLVAVELPTDLALARSGVGSSVRRRGGHPSAIPPSRFPEPWRSVEVQEVVEEAARLVRAAGALVLAVVAIDRARWLVARRAEEPVAQALRNANGVVELYNS
jgi:hypothetical protein